MDELFDIMTKIIKRDNPITSKSATPNSIPVGENKDVELAIQKRIDQRNKDSFGQEKTS